MSVCYGDTSAYGWKSAFLSENFKIIKVFRRIMGEEGMEKKIDDLVAKVGELTRTISVVREENKQIHHKVQSLDIQVNAPNPSGLLSRGAHNYRASHGQHSDPGFDENDEDDQLHEYNLATGNQSTKDHNSVQQEYKAIKDALQKLKLL